MFKWRAAREGGLHLLTPWPLVDILRCMQAKRAQLRGVLHILQYGFVARCFVAWRELAQVGWHAGWQVVALAKPTMLRLRVVLAWR